MGSKAFVLLGLLLATVLLIASEVTARDLVETSTPKETTDQTNNGVEDGKYYGGGGCHGYGCGGSGGGCHGYRCGGSGGGCNGYRCGGSSGGGNCNYGCCGHGYNGGCRRCCSYEGEPVDKED